MVAAAVAISVAQLPTVALADTQPPDPTDPTTPATVAADPLPTTQINGVAWTQLIVGNTVYVGGNFTKARPAGAAAGTNEVARTNLLAYDLTTGNLISSWAPTTNGDVLALAVSPDKSRIYVGGSFTQVNGVTKNRIAALNPTTGALITTFSASPDATVRAIVPTSDTVYMAGLFSNVGGVARPRAAAVNLTGGLLSWSPNVQGGVVRAMVMSPDGSQLLLGGAFTSVNGSSNPGYGLASVSPTTGASLPWAANGLIRNGGSQAAITSLTSDGADNVYATGYVFGAGGNLEGTARMSWNGGTTTWVEDCHGDTYQSFPVGDVVYAVSHAHYCGNLPDGFPQTDPWTFHWGTAFSKAVAGTLTADPYGYFNWAGTPSPNLLKWLPKMTSGTYTGQGQAGWSVTGNSNYIVYGGEFPTAGGATQQGLVRYAVKSIAPNKVGPEFTGSKINPTLTSFAKGTVKISWTANWDRDNEQLTYSVIRDGNTATPIYTTTQKSSEWSRPPMGFLDTNLTPGQSYRYRIFVKDPLGNEVRSDTVSIVASADGEISSYAKGVLDDNPADYWRFGENAGPTVNDWAGFNNGTAGSGVAFGTAGAINGDSNTAASFNGTGNGLMVPSASQVGSNTFTAEAWIKTTSTSGGKILGFGSAASGDSSSYDRHVYMTNSGQLIFGVYPNSVQTVSGSKAYNDGQWHHVVASLGSGGMALYVDGQKIGSRTDITTGQAYTGYWRVGGDNIGGWPNQPSSNYFNGSIDDVAIYPTVLTSAQVRAHYTNSGRTLAGSTAPADGYGKAVYTDEPDLYWRLGETSGTTAADATPNQLTGSYNGGVTLGQPSGVGVSGDTSVTLDGVNGAIASNSTFDNPTTYAEELWFNTTTTRGGKLIGFGSSQFGLSGGYDRHVYMFDDGRLRFGTWTGQTNVIHSSASYNDGKWHHLVAQQGSNGMQLWVDNQLVGTNPQTAAQAYTGYWRVGGDNTWGGNSSNYFAGKIDDVAIYSKTLSSAQIADHFGKGGGQLPNVKPTADFSADVTKLKVSFDGTKSSDSDGTIASYAWDFGDGATSTEAKPSHTFAAAGDQTVKLTVTDDDGATDSVTKTVTTTDNAKPTAAFTSSVNKLKVSFDGTGSTDADGTIASYAWDFGDGGTSTEAKPSHTFAAAGDQTVKLTVTDDEGATDSVTKTVTTVANAKPTAAFSSTVTGLAVSFDGTGSADSDGSIASYAWDFGDGGTSTSATPSHTFAAAGDQSVKLTVTDNEGATDSVTKTVTTVAPTGPLATDTFGRTASNGWGNAETGGAWTRYGTASLFSVADGAGQIRLTTAGSGPRIALESVSSTSTEVAVKVSLDKIAGGGGSFVSVGARTIGTNDYRAKVKLGTNGALTLYLVKVVNNAETTLVSTNLGSAFNYTAGGTLNVKVQATGTSPTTVQAKVWKSTQTEPASWQLTTTDSTAELQAGGGVGVVGYLSGSATGMPIVLKVDDLTAVTVK
ncbi:PKD domain-containing protein [Microlunatus ginsengisoli]|uniref:PKD domain-containing protein n=1 Tax=Microlunatus ginsengisoli TaxID=363863 RepID=UPI0031E0C115